MADGDYMRGRMDGVAAARKETEAQLAACREAALALRAELRRLRTSLVLGPLSKAERRWDELVQSNRPCPECGGKGWRYTEPPEERPEGAPIESQHCDRCNGSGRVAAE